MSTERISGYHSWFSGTQGKTIWTHNTSCQNQEKCFSIHCPHTTGRSALHTEFGQLKNYATYDDIEKLLENNAEDASNRIGKFGLPRSYRMILSQKMCTCGNLPNCRKLHSLEEILDIFRNNNIRKFYQTAKIKSSLLEVEFNSKEDPIVRKKTSFLCNSNNDECRRNLCLYDYNVSLLHKYNNQLDYPICHVRCNFCRQTRSVPIYI